MIIDDEILAIPEYSKICSYCRHALPEKRRCVAFDDDIPLPIWNGANDHTEPYKGDNGIQFEPIDEAQEQPNA